MDDSESPGQFLYKRPVPATSYYFSEWYQNTVGIVQKGNVVRYLWWLKYLFQFALKMLYYVFAALLPFY
jgi:hypothetical protein